MSDHTTNEIPRGYCQCGCGQKTKIATRTRKEAGWIKGQPLRYLDRHYGLLPLPEIEQNPTGLCMCGCGQPAPIAKRSNAQFRHIAGQHVRFIVGHYARTTPLRPAEERFWEKVIKRGSDECWEWQGGSDGHGYGCIGINDHTVKAHRFSYELHYGPIPDGIDILHKCDNPPCTNPDHLFAGTAKDNHDDMVAKGRGSKPPRNDVNGERNGHAQFTNAQVAEFRRQFAEVDKSVSAFAAFHDVPMVTMWNLLHYKTYKTAYAPSIERT